MRRRVSGVELMEMRLGDRRAVALDLVVDLEAERAFSGRLAAALRRARSRPGSQIIHDTWNGVAYPASPDLLLTIDGLLMEADSLQRREAE